MILSSSTRGTAAFEAELEIAGQRFRFDASIIVRTPAQIEAVLSGAPSAWKRGDHLRRYNAYLKEPSRARALAKEVETRDRIDTVAAGPGVSLLDGLTKIEINKIAPPLLLLNDDPQPRDDSEDRRGYAPSGLAVPPSVSVSPGAVRR